MQRPVLVITDYTIHFKIIKNEKVQLTKSMCDYVCIWEIHIMDKFISLFGLEWVILKQARIGQELRSLP